MASTDNRPSPPDATAIAHRLGRRIRNARVRRKIRQQDLAARTGLSRSSIQSLERGDLSCSMGILLRVLWNLGLAAEVDLIADPGLDRDGLSLSLDAEKKRVFVPRKVDNAF
jgi:transcriptional regulator with XRE-family HTH domain